MKTLLKSVTVVLAMAFLTTSCWTNTFNVGNGAQSGVQVTSMNHYLIYGLLPLKVSDPNALAGGASDYTVKIEHSFIDGLINAITFGIYTPTTTTVTK